MHTAEMIWQCNKCVLPAQTGPAMPYFTSWLAQTGPAMHAVALNYMGLSGPHKLHTCLLPSQARPAMHTGWVHYCSGNTTLVSHIEGNISTHRQSQYPLPPAPCVWSLLTVREVRAHTDQSAHHSVCRPVCGICQKAWRSQKACLCSQCPMHVIHRWLRVALWGRFCTARAQRGHSANYYGDYPGNSPENHPPAESCTISSKLKKFKHLMLAMGPRDLNSAPL